MGIFDSVNDDFEEEVPVAPAANGDARFLLISKLISTPDTISPEVEEYRKLEKLVRRDFLKLCDNIGFPGECTLFNELLLLLHDLRDLMDFPYLANKNVLAIGGGFSSGKSRFINSVLGIDGFLPEDISPSTAIPTYVTYAEKDEIKALNSFNRLQSLTAEELQSISHSFNAGQENKISFYHILKQIQIQSPAFRWKNIALLDTPGYSKPHDSENSEKIVGTEAGNTDEEKAREHLSQADQLVWVISVQDGTMQIPDIDFLKDKVKWNRPLYILINKCDDKPKSQVEEIFNKVREEALNAGFELAGISAYSAAKKRLYFGNNPLDWFDAVDKRRKFTTWRNRFNEIFDRIIQFNNLEKERAAILAQGLRPVAFKGDEILTEEQRQKLSDTIRDIEQSQKRHAAARESFVNFRHRADELLEGILSHLGIKDEKADSVGISGFLRIGEENISELSKGETFPGQIKSISKVMKRCYVSCKRFKDVIQINWQEVERAFTHPEQNFSVGKDVALSIYDIDLKEQRIVFTVTPIEE